MKTDVKKIIKQIVVMILCISINFAGRRIGETLHLPIWFDCVGTYVAAYFTSPVLTVLVAIVSQFVAGMNNVVTLLYTLTAIVVALSFIYCKKKQYMDNLIKMVISSFVIGILCVVVSTPLNLIFYDGYSGNLWGDALVDMLSWYGYSPVISAIAGEVIVEIVDKQICIILAYGLIRVILRWKDMKGKKPERTALSVLLIGGMCVSLFLPAVSVSAGESKTAVSKNYMSTIYNNTSGMMSSEANVIAQTEDGYIWIGSYAGLTRYNGTEFEFIRDGGIVNVTAMFCDSKGRLWVGTNSDGIARYENGQFTIFTTQNGMPANAIRSIVEDEAGNVYVGTTDSICCFDENDNISVVHEGIKYVVSMVTDGDLLAAIDNNGNLYALVGNEVQAEFLSTDNGVFCQCLKKTTKGILVGTADSKLYLLDAQKNTLQQTKYQVLEEVCGIEEDEDGNIWVCAESGFGYLDESGVFVEIVEGDFDSSFEGIMEDYQGNIWLASSRYGVLKLSESIFLDMFKSAGIENSVVNAVTEYQDKYYCGTDSGLVILEKNGDSVSDELTEYLAGTRIRCLMVDSKDRLWISTYGATGLVRYEASGAIEKFTMEEKNATSDRFRCTVELEDGTIVAGTSDGINFIKGEKIVDTITVQEDKLANGQILSLVVAEDGTIYAGSDGGGIYEIQGGEVTDTYTVEDGLSADIILRMVAYKDGYFVVTSNSLCFMENGNIRKLNNFPYFNNYDVIIKGETAYVLSSAGIYVADASKIVADEATQYELLGINDGLVAGLTANAWNFVDEEGKMFFCSNAGVISFDDMQNVSNREYAFGIVSMDCDGIQIVEEDGRYQLPLDAKYVTLQASVQNYTLQDVKVKFFVEGMEDNAEAVSYQKLQPIQLYNLTHGTYKVYLQILDNFGNEVLQEKVYYLEKEIQFWEQPWYKVYLVSVCIELIIFATWAIINIMNMSRRKNELETIRKELEEKVELQVKQIREQQEKEVQMFRKVIIALSDTVDAKDRYTSGHSNRVAYYSKMIAERMGKSKEEQDDIYYAGLLHDVGKIRVPESVINKPGKLTDEEFELIKIHTVTGYRILKNISEDSAIASAAKFHHERYDGKGYPNGLRGTNIPEIARIIGVADSYDAMASNRSYRNALPQEVVRSEIEKGKGTQFDPEVADIMLKMIDEDTGYKMKEGNSMNKTILVVDDEPMNIQMIQFIMKDETMYRVNGVESGEAALLHLETEEVDLILLDIEMPKMNGFETFKAIREKYNVPVVFTTSDREIETIQKAAELGVDDYLTKPFLPSALKEIVHSVLHFSE